MSADYDNGYVDGYSSGESSASSEVEALTKDRDAWKARAEKAGSLIAHETAELDRHVICELGTILLGTGKQCYSADAVLRAVNRQKADRNALRETLRVISRSYGPSAHYAEQALAASESKEAK